MSRPPRRKPDILRELAARPEILAGVAGASPEEVRQALLEAAGFMEQASAGAHLEIWIDGASRNNPGPSAAGVVVTADGRTLAEEGVYLGQGTNNVAEYKALLRALELAAEAGAGSVTIHSDSELLVKQMTGRYRVKDPKLAELHFKARALLGRIRKAGFVHVPRERNKRADMLANRALDDYIRKAGSTE